MIPSITTAFQSPAVQRALPYAYGAAGVAGCVLAVRFVVTKLIRVPKMHLIKRIVEDLIVRPANGAGWAMLIAWKFTAVPLGAAALMGGTIFLTARVCMFVAEVQFRTQWKWKLVGEEKTTWETWSNITMAAGALGGWQLGALAVQQLGFAPIALPVIVGVGIGAFLPALVFWKGIKKVSKLAFVAMGWRDFLPPRDGQPDGGIALNGPQVVEED